MSVNFEKNAYLSAVKERPHFNSESKIFDHTRTTVLQFKYADENGILKAIGEILKDSLRKKIIESGSHQIYFEIMKENISTNIVKGFFANLAQNCYEQTKKHFISQSSQTILQGIVEKATDQSTIIDFLKLKKK